MTSLAAVTSFLKRFAPLELAEDWDNVGLLVGDADADARKVMTCLTVTPASAAEAIEEQAGLIVSHHPVLFRPTQRLTANAPQSKMLLDLIRAGVAIYSPHTAFDNAPGGINDILARRLGLVDVSPLRPIQRAGKCKIVVFVPEPDLEKVSDALFRAGAGVIGEYAQCSYRVTGVGTFFGSDASNPVVGQKGRREEVSELRLEVVCPERHVASAIRAMRAAHSYEEPAFDVYPLQDYVHPGAGRIGKLASPATLDAFAALVKERLDARQVQVQGHADRRVERVALACGAGGEFLHDAIRSRADVFLTGEMRFHDHLAAEAQDLALVLPGHYATERPGVEELAELLQKQFRDLQVWASQREQEPTRCV
jgi:dinuclear metal center YbgI/SA1388 family protein